MNSRTNYKTVTSLLVKNAFVCALYTSLSLFLAPMSFGAVQLRLSEIMVLLAFANPALNPGLILGCFVTNMFSPFGIADAVVGTFATICAVTCISKSKNLFAASLWPTIFCVFIGAMISFMSNVSFIMTTLTIMLGEFLTVTCIGYPLFKAILKNPKWAAIIK